MIDESSKTKGRPPRQRRPSGVPKWIPSTRPEVSSLTQPRPGKRGWAAAVEAVAAREELPMAGLSNGDAMSMHRSTNTTYQTTSAQWRRGFGIDTVALV